MKLTFPGPARSIALLCCLLLPLASFAAPVAKPTKGAAAAGDTGIGQRLSRQNADQAAPAEAKGQAATGDDVLVALGTLGASNLYYSYLTLGTVADGYVAGTYDARVAVSVANEAIFMNGNARAGLAKLVDSPGIAKEDRDVIVAMIQTYDILNNQAKALIQFISDEKDDGSTYQRYRTEAWKRIVDLVGIKQ